MKQFKFFEKKMVPQTAYYEPLEDESISAIMTPIGFISSYTRSATNNQNIFKECFVGNTDFFYFYWRDEYIRSFETIRGILFNVEQEWTIRIGDFYEFIQRLREQGIVTDWCHPIISVFSHDGCVNFRSNNIKFSDSDMVVNIKWQI